MSGQKGQSPHLFKTQCAEMGAGEPAGVPAGVRVPGPAAFCCPSRLWADSQSSPWCHLSAAPPSSPKTYSTRSGSFVMGGLINFILINSVISSCLRNLHRALLCDGSAEGAADKHTILCSIGAIYILCLGEGGLGKGAGTLPACRLSMSLPKCPLFPGLGLLTMVPLLPLLFLWGLRWFA